MKANIKDGNLIVELAATEPRESSTGKMRLIATSPGGFADLLTPKGEALALGNRPLRGNITAGFFTGKGSPKPVAPGVKAVFDKDKMVLRVQVPIAAEGSPSSTGKMLLHAKTGGFVNTGLEIDGELLQLNLTVGVNA